MAAQPKRNPQKRPKDRAQGMALLNAVAQTMPQYALDGAFESEIPAELAPHYSSWNEQRAVADRPYW